MQYEYTITRIAHMQENQTDFDKQARAELELRKEASRIVEEIYNDHGLTNEYREKRKAIIDFVRGEINDVTDRDVIEAGKSTVLSMYQSSVRDSLIGILESGDELSIDENNAIAGRNKC